ncbi:MAG: plastocyanin/azurin family copper-binding protein [Gemmatimonadota bacterium]
MQRAMVRRGASSLTTLLLLAVAACGGDDPMEPSGGGGGGGGGTTPVVTTSVDVDDNFFDPASIQVSPGATVTFNWIGDFSHNVTFSDASITDIDDHTSGSFTTVMPTTPGDYAYNCTNHAGMNGTIKVQ